MSARALFIVAASLLAAALPVEAQERVDPAVADVTVDDAVDDEADPDADLDVEPDAEAAASGSGVDDDPLDDDPPGADPPGADDTIDGDPDHAALDEAPPVDPGTDPAWLVGAGAVTGLAALTAVAAVISWTYREGHVSRFNSDECVSATMTREELCYESAYLPGQQAELTTAVAAGIAGAAAITALVLFLVAPSRPPETDAAGWSCGAGPGAVGLACGARF